MKIRSQRIEGFRQSEIRAMTQACNALGGVNLGQGICDLPAPEAVKRAAKAAIDADQSTYSRFDGVDAFRHAVARKLQRYNGITYNPENEIVATVGSSGALTATLQALFDPGDELIVFEPSYGYHLFSCRVAGVVAKTVTLTAPDFAIDPERVRAAITPQTRAILVNTPSNPSGKVFTREELMQIAEICIEKDLLCITDEIYEYIVYDGGTHVSMASLPGMWERTITLSGYSKTFHITGWRLGYAAAPAPFALAIGLINDLFSICAPTPLQHGVAQAIDELPDSYYTEMCAGYQRTRDEFCGVLSEVGLDPIVPKGAYYVLADNRRLGAASAPEAAMKLLREAGVAGVAGSEFFAGDEGDHLIRFCYAKKPEAIAEASQRLRDWAKRA